MMDFKAEARKIMACFKVAPAAHWEALIAAGLLDAYRAGAHAGLEQANRLIRGEEAQPAELGLGS